MVFEPEETIGRVWHRLVGDAATYKRHPAAAATLDEMQASLALLFRAFGGDAGVRVVPAGEVAARHRLGLRQRIGVGRERIARPVLDGETLQLPPSIDCFPDRDANRLLYEWLVAWFAHAAAPPRPSDPLQADLAVLRHAAAATRHTLDAWPGLRGTHARLATALARVRPRRARGTWEERVEAAVGHVLACGGSAAHELLDDAVPLDCFMAPRAYRTFLPVSLWGELPPPAAERTGEERQEDVPGAPGVPGDAKRRHARRRTRPPDTRPDPLVLNRFEMLLAAAELAELDRNVDDDTPEAARQATDELDELVIGSHERRPGSALKLDLNLPAEAAEIIPLRASLTYPEWDHKRRVYHPDHCRVIVETAPEEGDDWTPDAEALRRIRQVRRHFEAFRPRRQMIPAQADGEEFDVAALVHARADLRAGRGGTDRVYISTRKAARDLSVAVLVDVSLSTESAIENRRVLDVEKEVLTALVLGLSACGDEHAIYAFTSRRRSWVSVRTVRSFGEALDGRVLRRIRSLKPGYYTRMGAAIRHAASCLEAQPNRHRLLLLLTDGKPNDIDHYEGRYGVEDTRMAIREARRRGLKVFGITVDAQGHAYFPYVFGRGAFSIFPDIGRLTTALPALYRQIAA